MNAANLGRGPKLTLAMLFGAAGITAMAADSKPDPLFDALRQGAMVKVKSAVNSGADVNVRDQYGNTLLMHAAVYGTAGDLNFLLAHDADVNAANQAGHTALMRAMPDLTKIKLLVEHKADINAATVDGTTPVMLAARIPGAGELLRYLIENGADLGRKDRRGSDALMIAVTAGAAGNLRILLDAGASGSRRRRTSQPCGSSRTASLARWSIARCGSWTGPRRSWVRPLPIANSVSGSCWNTGPTPRRKPDPDTRPCIPRASKATRRPLSYFSTPVLRSTWRTSADSPR